MPTASERSRDEAETWRRIAGNWPIAPDEKTVVRFFDPTGDLMKRGREWGHELLDVGLSSLAGFAAALCDTEATGWEEEARDLAGRAFEARRFLVGDRIVHWAIPWLDAVGRQERASRAGADRDAILAIADEMRVAPLLGGREGLVVPGEDSYGPLDVGIGVIDSLWSGAVVMSPPADPARHYLEAATRWESLAASHPGTARLWADLEARARRSSDRLS